MSKKVFFISLTLVLALILLNGCSLYPAPQSNNTETPPPAMGDGQTGGTNSTGTSTGGNQPPGQANITVNITNFAFVPPTITIKQGTTVTWINNDSAPHIIASDPHPTHTDLPGLISNSLAQGQSYSFTFDKVGTFGYHCHLHPSMKGTVTVTN